MKTKTVLICILILALFASSCRKMEIDPTPTPIPPAKTTPTPTAAAQDTDQPENNPVFADITDFESGINAFTYGFANYQLSKEGSSNLTGQIAEIPDISSKVIQLSGINQASSLLMYITKDIIVLPNTQYAVKIDFDIATNIKSYISSAANELQAVYIKAGINNLPFAPILDEENYYRSNWDIGQLNTSGPNGVTLGTAEKINSDDDTYQYKHFTQEYHIVTTDEALLCILIAADSSIPQESSIQFDNIIIEITQK